MSNPKRDRQGPERTPAGDRDEARPGHPHTGSAAAPGGHADHDPTHGRAMPTEDGQVMDPLQAVGRHGHDTHAGQGMGHGGHHGNGDHVAMFRRLFWIMLVLSVPTVLLSCKSYPLAGSCSPRSAARPAADHGAVTSVRSSWRSMFSSSTYRL